MHHDRNLSTQVGSRHTATVSHLQLSSYKQFIRLLITPEQRPYVFHYSSKKKKNLKQPFLAHNFVLSLF